MAAVNAQRLDFIEKQMSINVFHTISALKSSIVVYVNNLPYIQDGVVNI